MTTVAVVEDNADNRLLFRGILESTYDVQDYESGIDALSKLDHAVPAIVLLDISLPGMDGVEVLAHIRASSLLRHLPVIALTAHAMAGDREKYLACGFDDYVAKPIVDERDLLGAIERLLATRPAAV
jgi:CheY-like chemotaxis protein